MIAIGKPVLLTTVKFGTALLTNVVLIKAINKFAPMIKTEYKESDLEDQNLQTTLVYLVQILGVGVVITLIAAALANAATNRVENLFWPEVKIET